MPLTIKMHPEDGGRLVVDGDSFNPQINYSPGSVVEISVLPQAGYQFIGWEGNIPPECRSNMPLQIEVNDEQQEIIATFQKSPIHAAELAFNSDFENGNGILRYYDRAARQLIIEPEQINGADNIWWHFKIDNITPGEFLYLDVGHWSIAGDCQPVFSYDGIHWQRMNGVKSPYIQRFDSPSVEISRNIPYPYSRSISLAEELRGQFTRSQTLALSEGGRPVKMLRITDSTVQDEKKRVIWVMARQHAFESHSSYYAEGLAKWLNGSSAEADDVRQRFIVYVTPIMDVDNVFLGGSGKEQLTWQHQRVDFNRQWGDKSYWAAIHSAKRLLEEIRKEFDIAAFIDLHSPWYPESPHWDFPEVYESQMTEFAALWSDALEATKTGVQWKHQLKIQRSEGQGIEPTIDPNLRSATLYADEILFPQKDHRLCVLFEIPHWMDGYSHPITIEALYAYGEALGRALGRYFHDR